MRDESKGQWIVAIVGDFDHIVYNLNLVYEMEGSADFYKSVVVSNEKGRHCMIYKCSSYSIFISIGI